MLKSDYGNITNVAESLGYLNIYDFSRTFKKHTGISPTKYEKQWNH
jgi:YesN/AraC family two-component response regulator